VGEAIAAAFWLALAGYAGLGLCVAAFLLAGGLKAFDVQAAAAPLRVNLLLVPGMVALWPVLLARAAGWRPREDRA
jgi:hypothetical protein